jgi:hypothetical protein
MKELEMMEAAARAAGVEYHIDRLDGCPKLVAGGRIWNPRDDDGDSRRLEVALGMTVECDLSCTPPHSVAYIRRKRTTFATAFHHDHGGDAAAATRYAVLQCAALEGTNEAAPG